MTADDYLSLVGTPRYPLGHPGLARVWREGEGRWIDDAPFAHFMRSVHRRVPFRPGMCYSAADEVFRNAKANGWKNVVPYAGWLVMDAPDRPVGEPTILHHAWAVYFTGREEARGTIAPMVSEGLVVDFMTTLGSFALTREFFSGRKDELRREVAAGEGTEEEKAARYAVAWRKAFLELLRPLEEADIVTHRVFGKVPEGHTYIGCPSDPNDARKLFRDWHAKYQEGEGPGERSLTQEIEERMREGKAP